MLDFRPRSQDQGFTLDKRAAYRRRGFAQREWRAIVMMPFILGAVIYLWFLLMDTTAALSTPPPESVMREVPLTDMPNLDLAAATALPSEALIQAEEESAKALLDESDVSLVIGDTNARTLAWTRLILARDRGAAPVPQRAYVRDLLQGELRTGAPTQVTGLVVDHVRAPIDGGSDWQRVLLLADNPGGGQQFIQLLCDQPDPSLSLGIPVAAVGRYLGLSQLPSASGAFAVPTLATRLLTTPTSDKKSDSLSEFQRAVPEELPADLFAGISDERGLVETRAYYHLIGQARADRNRPPFNGDLLNQQFHKLHENPEPWRGKRLRTALTVYDVWDDQEAIRDVPFGENRITRILGYTRDLGPMPYRNAEGVVKHELKTTLRLVEFVLVGAQPRPSVGDRIFVDGRFFKYRAITVPENRRRDNDNNVVRQSNKAYLIVQVGSNWTAQPLHPPMTWTQMFWSAAVLLIFIGASIALFMIVRGDHRYGDTIASKIKRMRQQRRALSDKDPGKKPQDNLDSPPQPAPEPSTPANPS